ncbi:hypothetical protein HID58_076796, partial [Brassica napus]
TRPLTIVEVNSAPNHRRSSSSLHFTGDQNLRTKELWSGDLTRELSGNTTEMDPHGDQNPNQKPRILMNKDKKRCERRDQQFLQQKPKISNNYAEEDMLASRRNPTLNRLEQKKTSRLEFSSRASIKCGVRAISDGELELLMEAVDGGMRTDAVVEMIMEYGINHPEELKQVHRCYTRSSSAYVQIMDIG